MRKTPARLRFHLRVSVGQVMTPVELAARYRGYAIRCLLIEKHQFNVSDRVALADIAKALASLADCVEKNEDVFALFGARDSE
jgi:hypothetical protein